MNMMCKIFALLYSIIILLIFGQADGISDGHAVDTLMGIRETLIFFHVVKLSKVVSRHRDGPS